jgi:hypothetical protein
LTSSHKFHRLFKQEPFNIFNNPPYTRTAPCSIQTTLTMKYTVILAFVAGAFAIPQASITGAPAATSIPSGLSPAISCALACTPGDVMCQAGCLGNARPNASQVVDTNNCAAKCDQGDGSVEASNAFSNCVQGCINSLFPSSQTAFAPGAAQGASSVAARASATGGSMMPTGTASKSRLTSIVVTHTNISSGMRPSGSASGSASGSTAAAQSTGAADANSARFASVAGLAGFLAIFAL